MFRASVDCSHRELDLSVELAVCQNDVQLAKVEAWLTEAKAQHTEGKAWHTDTATAMQQVHLHSIATLD